MVISEPEANKLFLTIFRYMYGIAYDATCDAAI